MIGSMWVFILVYKNNNDIMIKNNAKIKTHVLLELGSI